MDLSILEVAWQPYRATKLKTAKAPGETAQLEETSESEETAEPEEITEPGETTELEKTSKPEETAKMEETAILTFRALDNCAAIPENTTEEAVMPITPSESLTLVIELNQDNAQNSRSAAIARRQRESNWRPRLTELARLAEEL